ncbi:unnamed protein product [Pieris macdunnoughi]|uniref:Uncharacterized protein n=1 Tax=Pieris macdunnoughi TaxID=345717 RepID=A0A821UI14_9NEOP|nr:unnamed protein product [Pieris macdunnoughi]
MGGCPVEAIKPGKIMRRGGRGIGEMFLLCPVAAAEKVRNGKLLIGCSLFCPAGFITGFLPGPPSEVFQMSEVGTRACHL